MNVYFPTTCSQVETISAIKVNSFEAFHEPIFPAHSTTIAHHHFLQTIFDLSSNRGPQERKGFQNMGKKKTETERPDRLKGYLQKFFCQDIPDYNGLSLNQVPYYNAAEQIVDYLVVDFTPQQFEITHSLPKSGSDIVNNTSTFCYWFNPRYLFFLADLPGLDVSYHKNLCFKLNASTNIATNDFLLILSHIFDRVVLTKLSVDTPLRDTFHVFCDNLSVERLLSVNQQLAPFLEQVRTSQTPVLNIFESSYRRLLIRNEFQKVTTLFFQKVHMVVLHFQQMIVTGIRSDVVHKKRIHPNWTLLDNVVKNNFFDVPKPILAIAEDIDSLATEIHVVEMNPLVDFNVWKQKEEGNHQGATGGTDGSPGNTGPDPVGGSNHMSSLDVNTQSHPKKTLQLGDFMSWSQHNPVKESSQPISWADMCDEET